MGGESDRWQAWVGRHGAALVLFARQWSATPADAEDAAQEGFVRFWRTRSSARDELAYLYACVRGAAMDLGRGDRRRVRRERLAGEQAERSEAAFDLPAERAERESAIAAALHGLPGDQREVVVMKIWGGLTFAQVAEALDISPNTAASRYRYAMARLEHDLREEAARDGRL